MRAGVVNIDQMCKRGNLYPFTQADVSHVYAENEPWAVNSGEAGLRGENVD
jgi:hypothetical protein